MGDNNTHTPWCGSGHSRRDMIRLIGAGGAVALAGCTGGGDGPAGDDGNGTTPAGTDTNGGGTPVEDTYVVDGEVLPGDVQFNPLNPRGYPVYVNQSLFDTFGFLNRSGEFMPKLASEWSEPDEAVEGEVFSLTIDDGYMWHDGSPVTAQDLTTQIRLESLFDYQLWDFISGIEEAGEKTVELELSTTVNMEIFKGILLLKRVTSPHSIFGEYASRLADATESDKENLKAELLEFRLDEPVGNGLWQWDRTTSQSYELALFEDHPYADSVNWSGITHRHPGESYEALVSGDVVDGYQAGNDVLNFAPDHGMKRDYSTAFGEAIAFNHQHEYFGQREVRMAILYAIDDEQLLFDFEESSLDEEVKEANVEAGYMDHMVGLSDAQVEQYDLADLFEGWPRYTRDFDRATELLESVDFTKEDDQWHTPEGDLWEPVVKAPSFWEFSATPTVGQLQQFGINAQYTIEEPATFWGQTIGNDDFGICSYVHGHVGDPAVPHPYWSYYGDFSTEDTSTVEGLNIPDEIEVPMPIGDPEGSLETVAIMDRITELGEISDSDRERELVELIAWAYNQYIPQYPNRQFSETTYYATDGWEYTEEGSDIDVSYIYLNTLHYGGITAKTQ